MIIKNAMILTDEFRLEKLDVAFQDKITGIGKIDSSAEVLDAEGLMLIPGFVDTHTHGCVGHDSCDGNVDGYEKMLGFYASKGVTSFLFTTMTLEVSALCDILAKIDGFIAQPHQGAYAHGIYLEGPFINCSKKGAQAGEHIIPPTQEVFDRFAKASGGSIRLVALAPESEGGMSFIRQNGNKYAISLAHTAANYDTAMEAFQNGAKSVTHLFNAMPPYMHRDPGVIGAAFDSDVFVEMICDGIHLHPSVIRSTFKTVGASRVVLVSDSMRAAGMPNGDYTLGGQDVKVTDGKAVLADGTIAGSASNLLACVQNAVSFGIPLEDAVRAASLNPATLIGVDDVTGSIKAGKYADLVLVDRDLQVQKVWVKGQLQA